MIISKEIKLKLKLPVTKEQVEEELHQRGYNVLRWAVTKTDGEIFTISAAIEEE